MALSRILALAGAIALGSNAASAQEAATAEADRIVSIGGSLTEIVYALGEEDRLIARDTTSTYPEAALKLPDVGYMRQLSPEGVLSVTPGAIIALEGSGPPETIEVLKKATVPIVMIPETFDREGILTKIRKVGEALGVEDKAADLAARVDEDIRAAEAAAEHEVGKKVLFVLSLQGGKVMASGTDTAAAGIIEMAGGVNAMQGFRGYKQLADEAIIEAQPEVILMMNPTRSGAATNDAVLANPAIMATPAGKAGAVIRMDGSWLLGFGPRTAEAIGKLSATLYGQAPQN